MSTTRESPFALTDFMEAWGELRASVLVAIEPERLAREPYPEEHRHDLRVKLREMERQVAALTRAGENPVGSEYGFPLDAPGHQHHRARDGRQA